jgi:hypothetical protein
MYAIASARQQMLLDRPALRQHFVKQFAISMQLFMHSCREIAADW